MKKRKLKQGLALILSLFMTINYTGGYPGSMPVVSYADTVRAAKVSATSLNIRSGPGTTYSIVGKLSYGAAVSVVSETTGSDGKIWYQVRYTQNGGTVTGYALSTYIKFPVSYQSDAEFEAYLTSQGFPESYKAGLRQLHGEYPQWVFKAQHTNLDWNTVIQNESVVGRNLVSGSSVSSWKSIADGAFNWDTSTWPSFDSGSWVAASSDIISYYMDPRNFLNEKYVFQFLLHSYDGSEQNIDGLKTMIQGTFLNNDYVSSSGTSQGTASIGSGVTGVNGGPGVTGNGSGSNGSSPGTISSGNNSSGTAGQTSGSGSGVTAGVGPGGSGTGSGSGTSQNSNSGPGVSSGSSTSGGSGTSTVQPGVAPGSSGNGNGNVSQQAPSGGNSGVSLQAPGASVSKKETNRVGTTIGPGYTSGPGADTVTGPGEGSSDTGSGTAPTASYGEIIMKAGEQAGVNPYVLAAMILQEQGSSGTRGISGTVSGYEGYYNFFNIEAYQSGSMSAIERGLWFASQSGSYERPWNSVEKAILGGAMWYSSNYVKAGQDTFYLKKFNVQGNNIYKHQYMTNVEGAASEGAKLEEAYSSQLKQTALEFKIPVYLNMPDTPCAKPTLDGSPNNKLSGLGVDGFVLTPTFSRDTASYDLIVDTSVTTITVSAAALDSTAVISGTGSINIQGGKNEIVVSVTAQNGSVRQYTINVVRQENGPTHNSSLGSGIGGSSPSGGPGVVGPGIGTNSSQGSTNSTGSSQTGPGVVGPGVSQGSSNSGSSVQISDGPGSSSGNSSGSQNVGPGGSNVTIVQ